MPSTTVHLPDHLLLEIDRFVKREGISRNKFIIKACEIALKINTGKWPDKFFRSDLSKKDQELLTHAVDEMESTILNNRRNRMGVDT